MADFMFYDDEYIRFKEVQDLKKSGSKAGINELAGILGYEGKTVYSPPHENGPKDKSTEFLTPNGNGDDGDDGGEEETEAERRAREFAEEQERLRLEQERLAEERRLELLRLQEENNLLKKGNQGFGAGGNRNYGGNNIPGWADRGQADVWPDPNTTQGGGNGGNGGSDGSNTSPFARNLDYQDLMSKQYTAGMREGLVDQMQQRPLWWPAAIPWPPSKVLGTDLAGQPIVGIDWDIVIDTAKNLNINVRGEAITDASIAKKTQEQIIASDPSMQANPWDMPIPGTKASLPVMRSADGSIQEIDVPTLDRQIDRAIIDGDVNRAKTLIGIRDAPTSQEKLSFAMQIARSPADVYQLGAMASGQSMERFGEMAPYLRDAVTGVFGQDPFKGLTPQGGGESLESLRGRIPQAPQAPMTTGQGQYDPYVNYDSSFAKPESGWFAGTEINQRTPQGGMNGQAGMPMASPMGMGGAFIQEAPADLVQQRGSYAALEDFYEDEPYDRLGAMSNAPVTSPSAVGTTPQRRLFDQMIAEGMSVPQAYRYSQGASSTPSTYQQPNAMIGDDRSMGGDPEMDAFRRANQTPTPKAPQIGMGDPQQDINKMLAGKGYFMGSSGKPSTGWADPEQEQNMFFSTPFSGGMPPRVQNTLVEGHSTPAPNSLLSQVGLRTPSMQSYKNWLPEEILVAERELEMRGLDKSKLWESVKYGTPGVAQNRAHWVDAFRD